MNDDRAPLTTSESADEPASCRQIVLQIASILFLGTCVTCAGCSALFNRVWCKTDTGSAMLSADGRYGARIVSQDCGGATTAGTTEVVVTDHNMPGKIVVFRYPRPSADVTVSWRDRHTLLILHPTAPDDWIASRIDHRSAWRTLRVEDEERE